MIEKKKEKKKSGTNTIVKDYSCHRICAILSYFTVLQHIFSLFLFICCSCNWNSVWLHVGFGNRNRILQYHSPGGKKKKGKKKRILGSMYSLSLKTSQTPRIYFGGSNLPGNWIEVWTSSSYLQSYFPDQMVPESGPRYCIFPLTQWQWEVCIIMISEANLFSETQRM